MNTEKPETKEKKKRAKKVRQTKVYPFYSVTQLSEIFGMTRLGTRNMLDRMNLPAHFVGNKIIYYLSDLQTHQPELFSSILEANQLNSMLHQPNPEPTREEDFSTKEQFQ